MPAGKYRDRITIEAPAKTEQADGQVTSWPGTTHAVLWANVTQGGGGQNAAGANRQQQGERSYRIELRTSPEARAIDHTMRVDWEGRTLNVAAVDTATAIDEVFVTATEKPV